MKPSKLKGLVLSVMLSFSALTHADVISFAANPNFFIDGNYAGFNWSGESTGHSWVNGSLAPLWNSPTAVNGYAWSNGGADLEFSLASPGTFTFDSFDVYADASLWGGSPSTLTIQGWSGGVLVHSYTTGTLDTLPRGAFSTVVLGWSGIDTVKFAEMPGQNILLANLTVNGDVPEPATAALLAVALIGMALSRRAGHRQSV